MSNYYGHLKKKHGLSTILHYLAFKLSGKFDVKLFIPGISVSGRNREEQLRATAMSSNVAEKAGEVYVCDVCQKSFGRTRDLVVCFNHILGHSIHFSSWNKHQNLFFFTGSSKSAHEWQHHKSSNS